MRPWISCEQKLELLDRMYSVAHSHLGGKDEAVYVAMRQELVQRMDAMKGLRERVTHARKQKPKPAEPEATGEETPVTAPEPKSAELGPEEVVRLFISCWDTQDFDTEYSLLSPTFLQSEGGAASLEEYTKLRKAKHSSRLLRGQLGKQLESVCSCRISGAQAIVDCVETRRWHHSTSAQRRRYHLRHYPEGWLIDFFESVLERRAGIPGRTGRSAGPR